MNRETQIKRKTEYMTHAGTVLLLTFGLFLGMLKSV
jgi:hypothetical protein